MSSTANSQADKARIFRVLHERPGAFIIPNPWDAGSARMLAALGFEALATTSAGAAFSMGYLDDELTREQTLDNARAIVNASELPVSADLGRGFGDSPEAAAETIRAAAAAGLVGGSIEDFTGREDDPIYDKSLAVERVRAAVEAARTLPFPFTLTARAENLLHGRKDLKDTIERLQAYQQAGADVLYAPGLMTREEIKAVVSAVDRPVNVLAGMMKMGLSVSDLAELGAKRISLGGSLYRTAMAGFLKAAREMKESGTFSFADAAVKSSEIARLFAEQ